MFDQDPNRFSVTKECCQGERCESVVARDIGIRAVVQQRAHDSLMTVIRRAHQRRHAILVAHIYVHDTRQQTQKFINLAILSHAPQFLRCCQV
jgi:hypothetical protein